MVASRVSSCVAMAAAAASLSTLSNRAYADGPFRFYPFSSSSSSSEGDQTSNAKSKAKPEAEDSKASGFDPESLERGAKALREINNSPNAKQVFLFLCALFGIRENMGKQGNVATIFFYIN
jgi:ATPase family AAA domain-containing protein 3A/B